MSAPVTTYDLALRMGDNCLILGQRISQWCGHAPILEEDIAQANIALDLIGQAQYWLGLAGEIETEIENEGEGESASEEDGAASRRPRSADDLAYLRDAHEFRNFALLEVPNGDYARSLMRQFLFDNWHYYMLQNLSASTDARVARIAGKALKEVSYHLQRSTDLVVGLGDGSTESHERMQRALDDLWKYVGEMFDARGAGALDPDGKSLQGQGIAIDMAGIKRQWDLHFDRTMGHATLTRPATPQLPSGTRRSAHTEHLGYILAEMQFLQRAYPGSTW